MHREHGYIATHDNFHLGFIIIITRIVLEVHNLKN